MKIIILILTAFSYLSCANETYYHQIVKNRAAKQKRYGISRNSRKTYIYADDEDIENALKNQKNGNKIEIASPNIDKRTPLREVHIVVNAKNPIKAKNIKKLDIASPTIDHKSMIRKINVELKLKKGVKIK